MNYLNILDSISDRSKVYFLPVDSTGIVSYENAFLTFHLTDLEGNKVTDIPGNYDSNGVYFDPINLIGLSVGKVYGLYLEIRTRTERNYFPGQEILYLILTTDAKLSILKDIPADYLKSISNNNKNQLFSTVSVQTLPSDSVGFSKIVDNELVLGIPQGKAGVAGPPGPQGPQGLPGKDGTIDSAENQAKVKQWIKDINHNDSLHSAINVLQNGAYGDGTHDDSQAIQDAIDQSKATGGAVYFPDGKYLIKQSLKVYGGTTLIGNSQQSVKIIQNTGQTHISGTDCNYVTIKNITFQGPGMDASNGGGIGFGRQNNDNIMGTYMENVSVINCVGLGISINCPITSLFNNVRVMGIVGNGFSFYQSGTSVTMNSCYAITCTQAGYELNQMNYCTFNSCAVEVCGIGFYLRGNCNSVALIGCGAEDQIPRNTVDGVVYKGVDYQLEGGIGNSMTSCYSRNNQYAGISLIGGNPTITSYRQIGNAQYGIIADDSARVKLINNNCASKVQVKNEI